MTYWAVAYLSTAVAGLTTEDLDHLLVDARAHNRLEGVTGVLLHDGARFFQYFEGTQEAVARIYARIQASRMHVEIEELQNGPVPQRHFTQWHMGCTQTEGSVLQTLSSRQWRHEVEFLREDMARAGDLPGLRELLAFWEEHQQAEA
ncbi:BLUF domain-containing protein [Stenotrophomonas mori]|uniref:BLUF domain-containing protein n=1 Tax=Stenotrophomonas mori TaxID=2871096 RepID=A0ABT0SCV6_9GAMM|nr:BLUF domain-containing protein [Stenotrophomonas mori]MCL7713147.1 BLUF domain-containing protein [Stenotrophomonas mori]